MTTTTVRRNGARRRRRLTAPLLLMAPTVAAILLSGAPAEVAMFSSVSKSPVSVSGDQIELVKSNRELAAREPRDHRGDGSAPAPIPGGPGPSSKDAEWDIGDYDNCMMATVRDADACCLMSGGITGDEYGECYAPPATMGGSQQEPGRPGLPTEAVDTGSPQQGSPPLPPVAVDPGSPQSPPTTTAPPVVRDHRTP